MTDLEALSSVKALRNLYRDNTMIAMALDKAAGALREQVERDNGCDTCNNVDMYSLLTCAYEFNYCPMCGRKLKGCESK